MDKKNSKIRRLQIYLRPADLDLEQKLMHRIEERKKSGGSASLSSVTREILVWYFKNVGSAKIVE